MTKNIFNPEDQQGIVDHMNDDHTSSLIHYCHLLGMPHITEKDTVVMTGIDQDGFDLEVNGKKVRYVHEKPMKESREVRKVLVTLTRKVLPDK
jgi:putative heme iron utilization protein